MGCLKVYCLPSGTNKHLLCRKFGVKISLGNNPVIFYIVIFLHWFNVCHLVWQYLVKGRPLWDLKDLVKLLHLYKISLIFSTFPLCQKTSSSAGCVSFPCSFGTVYREFIFLLLLGSALRQALLQCLCPWTRHMYAKTSTLEWIVAILQELSYQTSLCRTCFVLCCVLPFLAMNSLCSLHVGKSQSGVCIQGQALTQQFLEAGCSMSYVR